MNDAGLDEPIAHASSEVRDTYHDQSNHHSQLDGHDDTADAPHKPHQSPQYQSPAYSHPRKEDDLAHHLPTRWWYASTAFPLLAGTFGPMANAFSICALVENWRIEVPPEGTEGHGINIPDPTWLIAVNAVSLVFALIANLSLLLNMAKRLSFRWAQPITILGFWLSSVLLTILVGIAAHHFHAPGVQKQALSQAYYYACWAAGLYQIISLMMCVTVYGALTNQYSNEFKLTMAQRTLMLQTISFLTYLLLGALVYSRVESWKFLDAVYWADFTLLTVGVGGDMVPTTHLGRSLLFPFSIGGIVMLGLVVSSIRTMVLERGKRKLHARMTEKMRRKVVKQVDEIYKKGKAKRKRVVGLNNNLVRRLTLEPTDDPEDELNRRRAEFEAMRTVEELTSRRQKWMHLTFSTIAFSILWFIGSVVFWQTEGRNQGWSYFTALYFAWTSLLTIGYGDYLPLSNAGRPFFVFWSLLAVPSLTILISDMGDTVVKGVKDVTIWIGEVTILPSSQGSVMERLRYGIFKALHLRMSQSPEARDEERPSDSDSNSKDTPLQQPGLVKLFRFPRRFLRSKRADEDEDRLGKDFEESERKAESEARSKGDRTAEDEHHYHHVLISEIRKLHTDANAATPKRYTYDEWAYYLNLLGEDESSSTFHRNAPVNANKERLHQHDGSTDHTNNPERPQTPSSEQRNVAQWSWIGPRSPLMTRGDQSESEWLVSRLFERLEESLRDLHGEKKDVYTQVLDHSKGLDQKPSRTSTPQQPPSNGE
ncbi:hypothetical protein Dsin_033180 [Dipteronia sinensis]|uniref:Potassium channel domain-containing protein n=1 Tax=Dipteronia sinensis TaxID=43782 RepID=A0AAE0DNZ7_9ROSI|nr:hypothetical protein Dsin_033180 [Dipteronia sinensis]